MKTNIKMRVTPEQSRKVQEICFKNGIEWKNLKNNIGNVNKRLLLIDDIITFTLSEEIFRKHIYQKIDAGLFIRTNGTCEENELKGFIQSQNEIKDGINEWAKQFNDIKQKQKKKNEILKKARIKRKNQREELYKLNLKLQKCISFEEHTNMITVKNNVIKELENENYLNKSKLHLSSLNNIEQQKEIEKLKVVIEYLESKVK